MMRNCIFARALPRILVREEHSREFGIGPRGFCLLGVEDVGFRFLRGLVGRQDVAVFSLSRSGDI